MNQAIKLISLWLNFEIKRLDNWQTIGHSLFISGGLTEHLVQLESFNIMNKYQIKVLLWINRWAIETIMNSLNQFLPVIQVSPVYTNAILIYK